MRVCVLCLGVMFGCVHSRSQSPSFLGQVVRKRGATDRLQIKPSGSGDENAVCVCGI